MEHCCYKISANFCLFAQKEAILHPLVSQKDNSTSHCRSMRSLSKVRCSFTSRDFSIKRKPPGASLVAQGLGVRLPMQGTRVWALVQEDPTCRRAIKPVHHNYWACALESKSQLLSPRATTTEARAPRACAPQQEKPLQWEACAPQWRVAPALRN